MIWIVGNKGMLGVELENLLKSKGEAYCASDREVDISDHVAVNDFCEKIDVRNLRWIINCAAYTAVDKAEDEKKTATSANEIGPANLASISKRLNVPLIHISTDYVFPGTLNRPLLEDDDTEPVNFYGESKLRGEKRIFESECIYYIIRTAWLYGKFNKNFVYTMLDRFSNNDVVKIVSDQWGSPTYAKDLSAAIFALIDRNRTGTSGVPSGIYHFTNEGRTNWFEFAQKIYQYAKDLGIIRKNVEIRPVTTKEYPTKAKRPEYSYLSKDKIRHAFFPSIRKWEAALRDFLEEIKNECTKQNA
jgi:dTDP-4-dehydrorhamnose reductase